MTRTADQIETVTTRWSSPAAADQLTVMNPATGRPLAIVAGGGPAEADAAGVRTKQEHPAAVRHRAGAALVRGL